MELFIIMAERTKCISVCKFCLLKFHCSNLSFLQAAGGDCFVENSVIGLERDIKFVQEVAKDTGVKVVAGTGLFHNCFYNYLFICQLVALCIWG